MPFYGSIVVIKRSGADGSTFPLINEVSSILLKLFELNPGKCFFCQECLLGRAEGCDIRIQLPIVSKEHAKLKVKVKDSAVTIKELRNLQNAYDFILMFRSTL